MARLPGFNTDAFLVWLRDRPACVQEAATRYPVDRFYRMRSTGHRVTLMSYEEREKGICDSARVMVSGKFNAVAFERQVFGIPLSDLEECELPGPDEILGSADLSLEEVKEIRRRDDTPEGGVMAPGGKLVP